MADYPGYNQFLQAKDGYVATRPKKVIGVDFMTQYDVQARRVKTSEVNVTNLIQTSNTGNASGSFDTDTSVTVDITLSPIVPYLNRKMFGLPQVAVYEGTAAVGSLQLYPSFGSGISNGDYAIHSGFDLTRFDGTVLSFAINIENNSGVTKSLYAETQWQSLYYNTNFGTSS